MESSGFTSSNWSIKQRRTRAARVPSDQDLRVAGLNSDVGGERPTYREYRAVVEGRITCDTADSICPKELFCHVECQ